MQKSPVKCQAILPGGTHRSLRGRLLTLGLACSLLAPSAVRAQADTTFGAEYTVSVKDTAAHLFHVSATFFNIRQRVLDLALPVWMPGHYQLENYGKHLLGFAVSDSAGRRITAGRVHPQTWRVEVSGRSRITADFDYVANILDTDQAKIASTFAFFTGVQLFLEPIGHSHVRAKVRFVMPAGWRVVSALHETTDSSVFTASSYDALADAPTWLGRFDLQRFDVDGKAHYVVLAPGKVPADSIPGLLSRLAAMVTVERAIFGRLPYDKYTFFFLPRPLEGQQPGAIEHATSFVASGPNAAAIDQLHSAAHEFFHLWNVKRIRPAELWPYDYSRPQATPSLWVSEGITSYYGNIAVYRAGFQTDTGFFARLAGAVTGWERSDARGYMSPSDASEAVWVGGASPSYYDQGEVLGALLDLSILHDTKGERGLDDVMRAMFHQLYERGRGFTPMELIRTVSSVAGRDYAGFFRRYVTGVEPPPYDTVFRYAGVKVAWSYSGGIVSGTSLIPQGRRVDAIGTRGPGALAGLRLGDIIVAIDDTPVRDLSFWENGCCLRADPGRDRVVLTVIRDSTQLRLPLQLGVARQFDLAYESTATNQQLTVRRAWLRRQ